MSKVFFSIYVWTCYVVLFLLFFVLILVTFILTFPFDRYRKTANRVLSMMAWCLIHISPWWKITIEGTEKYDPSKPTIFICNHESFLDIPLLYQLPWKMKWVVKHSMTYIPVMGWMVRLTGQLTINRSSKSALKKLKNLVKPLKDLVPVMIFPEGTRSIDGKLQSFKNGAFLLAMEHGFNLQPIIVDGPYEVLISGSRLMNPKGDFKISVLDPVDPSDFDNMNTLKSHCRQLILDEKERLESS